jgi:hypothetical protein
LLVFVLFSIPSSFAQRDLGTITGVVTDASGAVVPRAKLTFTQQTTSERFSAQTGDTGTYARPLLHPGLYTVEAEAAGFRKAVEKDVLVTEGGRTGADFVLTVGEVTQTAEVTAIAPLLQTQTTIEGQDIGSQQVQQLPLGGQRMFSELARLSPAVLPTEPGARDQYGGGFSANGVGSSGNNNFLFNGVDNNNNVIDLQGGSSYIIKPSMDAIGEMRVLVNGYNAEYGRGAGGVVEISLKSGSNQLHGSVFEYLQNTDLNANLWESNRAGEPRSPMKQNQFGATAGGPIVKQRTFFFVDYQGTRLRSLGGAISGLGGAYSETIPRPAMKTGDFSSILGTVVGNDPLGSVLQGQIYDILTTRQLPDGTYIRDAFPRNIIPTSRIDPVSQELINLFPNPNQNFNTRLPSGNYYTVTNAGEQIDQGDVRIDQRLSDKDMLFGSLTRSDDSKFNGPALPGALDGRQWPIEWATENDLSTNAMLSYARVWQPNILTETRAAFTRLVTAREPGNNNVDEFKAFGIGGYDPTVLPTNGGLPYFHDITNYTSIGPPDWIPSISYSTNYDFMQNLAINTGRHALKFGAEYRLIDFPFIQIDSSRGRFYFHNDMDENPQPNFQGPTGDAMAAVLIGYPSYADIATHDEVSDFRHSYAFYGQDDWKVTPKLTINLGLRYELSSPIGERFGRQANFDYEDLTLYIPKGPQQNLPMPTSFAADYPMVTVSRGAVSNYLIPWDKYDFGPRIGIAYKLAQKTVLRVAYGTFFSPEQNQGGSPNRGKSLPFHNLAVLQAPASYPPWSIDPLMTGTISQGFPTNPFDVGSTTVTWQGEAQDFRSAMVQKWNAGIQRELGWNTLLDVAYIGNHQSHLGTWWDPNSAPLEPNVLAGSVNSLNLRPIPAIGSDSNALYSFGYGNYASLGTKVEKRFSNGLSFVASYTWAHGLASAGSPLNGGSDLRDPRDASSAYSSWLSDVRHSYTTGWVYELPFGRSQKFGSGVSHATNLFIGGWQLNGILSLRTGQPYTLETDYGVGYMGTIHPSNVPGENPNSPPPGGRTPAQWFNTAAVINPAPYTIGEIGDATMCSPGTRRLDLSMFKEFRATERYRLQFRAEGFNVFNNPAFQAPGNTQGAGNFGRIDSTYSGSQRKFQFALKLMF